MRTTAHLLTELLCLVLLLIPESAGFFAAAAPADAAAVIIGIAIGTHRGTSGYIAFVRSALAAAPASTLILIVDEPVAQAVDSAGLPLIHAARLRLLPPPPGAIPRRYSRLSMIMSRYWLYLHAVETLIAERAAAGINASLPLLVWLSDTRDVVMQRDPFVGLQQLLMHSEEGGARLQPGLVVVAEPAHLTLGSDAWNWRLLNSVFRLSAVGPYAPLPVLCAGTTGGTLSAVHAYLVAMTDAMPFATSGGQGYLVGADQALHNYLLHPLLELNDSPLKGVAHAERESIVSTEPAYSALQRIFERLRAATRVIVTHHEDGEVCTLGVVSHNRVPLSVPEGAEGYWRADVVVAADSLSSSTQSNGHPASSTAGARTVYTADGEGSAIINNAGARTVYTADGEGSAIIYNVRPDGEGASLRACAIVHQYDRHMQLRKWVDVRWLDVPENASYCDTELKRCW